MKHKIKTLPIAALTISLFVIKSVFSDPSYASDVYYLHQDHLGSTAITTKDGQLQSRETYYPYGTSRSNSSTSSEPLTEKGYTGQISDQIQTGLMYYNARYYNPVLGKFIQPDNKFSINRYAYVNSNPLKYVDLTGNEGVDFNLNTYLQTDPSWGKFDTGYKGAGQKTTYLFEQIGCGYTVIAMLASTYVNPDINPMDVFNNYASDATGNGLLGYPEVLASLKDLGFNITEVRKSDANYLAAVSEKGHTGLLTVTLTDVENGPEHWTIIVSVNKDGTMNLQDPLYGKMTCQGSLSGGGSLSCTDESGKKHELTVNMRWVVEAPPTTNNTVTPPTTAKQDPFDLPFIPPIPTSPPQDSQSAYRPQSAGKSNSTGGTGSGGCFTSDTKILMADGTQKNISDIKKGDHVISYDVEKGERVVNEVDELLVHPNNSEGYFILNGNLKVTPNHVVYVQNKKEWLPTKELAVGDSMLNADGKKVTINSITKVEKTQTVYNLHLTKEPHNFFAEGLLVHNSKALFY